MTPALDAVVEGAWLALVYAAVQLGLAHGDATLGPLPFAIAAGVGVAWARPGGGRSAGGWRALAAIAIVAGALGWLSDPAARDAVAAAVGGGWSNEALGTAIATDVGGWLLSVAILRGAAHASRWHDEERTGAMLERIPLLAIPWAIGLSFSLERRPEFVATALVSTLLFVGGGLVAVGLGRLESFGPAGGVEWRRNRAWLAVVGGIVALLIAVAVPAAFLVGAPPSAIVDALVLPLAAIVGVFAAIAAALAAPLVTVLASLIPSFPAQAPSPTPAAAPLVPVGGILSSAGVDSRVGLTIGIITLVVTSLVVLYIAYRVRPVERRRRAQAPPAAAPEERSFVVPSVRANLRRVPRRGPLRGSPRTAPEAYLALLDDLSHDPRLARGASEAPRGHARRVLASGLLVEDVRDAAAPAAPAQQAAAGRDLGLLVADWELARYAERALTAAEDRRGVGRWRRLRAATHDAAARARTGAR